MTDTTIIIPVYNEEDSIANTISEVEKYNPDSKILVVNDKSTDNTLDILDECQKNYKKLEVISHEQNRGYGAALISGFRHSKTELVGFLDADMTYHPKYFPTFRKNLVEKNLDCVWGNRFIGRHNKMPVIRKFGNRILILIFWFVTGKKVKDISSGIRLFKKEALVKIDYQTLPSGLDMITAMTKRIVSRKIRFRLIGIKYTKRSGSSKLNIFKDFIKMLRNVLVEK